MPNVRQPGMVRTSRGQEWGAVQLSRAGTVYGAGAPEDGKIMFCRKLVSPDPAGVLSITDRIPAQARLLTSWYPHHKDPSDGVALISQLLPAADQWGTFERCSTGHH